MAKQELQQRLAAATHLHALHMTLVERYAQAPAGPAGLYVAFDDGHVTVRAGIDPDMAADVEIDSIFADAIRSVTTPVGPAYQAFTTWRIAQGRLQMRGELGPFAPLLVDAHDAIGRQTRSTEPG